MSHPDVEHASFDPVSHSGNNVKSKGHEAYGTDPERIKDGMNMRKCINDDKRYKDEMAKFYPEGM